MVHVGLLLYKERVVLPGSSPWIPRLLHEFYDLVVGGHSGYFRTYKRVASNLFWPRMKEEIRDYVTRCVTCQSAKSEAMSPAGLMQSRNPKLNLGGHFDGFHRWVA